MSHTEDNAITIKTDSGSIDCTHYEDRARQIRAEALAEVFRGLIRPMSPPAQDPIIDGIRILTDENRCSTWAAHGFKRLSEHHYTV